MANDDNQNREKIKEILKALKINSLLKIGAAISSPEGIRYKNYVNRIRSHTGGDRLALADITISLHKIMSFEAGVALPPDVIKEARIKLNTALGRSGDMELNDDELAGISGAIQVLDTK